MKKLLFIFSLVFLACKSNYTITIAKLPTGTTLIGILTKDQKPGFIPNDFQINAVSINLDTLFVEVQYSGGCNIHEFHIYEKTRKKDTLTFGLLHRNNGDVCRALISEKLWFDLSPLKNKKAKPITLKIDNFDGKLIY